MPKLTNLTSMTLQLEALRTVRSQSSTKYKEIEKQKAHMIFLLRSIYTSQQRGMGLATMIEGISHQEYSDYVQSYY